MPDTVEREYSEEKSDSQIKPEINKEVVGLERLNFEEDGACQSKNNQIRDCRDTSKDEQQQNEDENEQFERNQQSSNDDENNRKKDDEEGNRKSETDSEEDDTKHQEVDSNRSLVGNEEELSDVDKISTQATEADVDPDILDHQSVARRTSEPILSPNKPIYEERKQNAIEFWELAQLLSQALNFELPNQDDADFGAIDADEGVNIEKNLREITVNTIMEKIREILERIKRIEEQRVMTSRQQSIRSNKSTEGEKTKSRSSSVTNASSVKRMPIELSYHRHESIIE